MVYGHADGLLNNYIYQFHVGAFFITSGLVFNIEKDGIFATIYKKIIYCITNSKKLIISP